MLYRPYDVVTDFDAVRRIWLEAGWIKEDDDKGFVHFMEGIHSRVAEVDRQAERHVSTARGTMRFLSRDLPVSIVATVLTSYRVLRKRDAIHVVQHQRLDRFTPGGPSGSPTRRAHA